MLTQKENRGVYFKLVNQANSPDHVESVTYILYCITVHSC